MLLVNEYQVCEIQLNRLFFFYLSFHEREWPYQILVESCHSRGSQSNITLLSVSQALLRFSVEEVGFHPIHEKW